MHFSKMSTSNGQNKKGQEVEMRRPTSVTLEIRGLKITNKPHPPTAYRASPRAIKPSAISSKSALRSSLPGLPIDMGGIFSLPG